METALQTIAESQAWLAAAGFATALVLGVATDRYRRLYKSAVEREKSSADLIANLSEGIYRSTPEGRMISANLALVKLNGYASDAELLASVGDIGTEWYVDPKRRRQFREFLMQDGRVTDFVSEIYRHKTRERIWVSENARMVRDPNTGLALYYEGSVREVSNTVRRLQLEEQFRKLASQVPGGLFQMVRHKGGEYSLPFASSGFAELSGLDAEGPLPDQMAFLELVHEDDRRDFVETLRLSGERLVRWDLEFKARRNDGAFRWLRVTATPETVPEGILWHGYIADISQKKANEQSIERLAFFDPLTELPNRRKFLDRVSQAVRRRNEAGGHGALLFIDLDNFKSLNDIHGHEVGDQFLRQVAERLKPCVRGCDTVARIGGDEFVILIESAGADSAMATRKAIVTADRALSALREEYQIGPLRHRSSASIGVVVFGPDGDTPEQVLKHADIAMYRAKSSGRDAVAVFDREAIDQDRWRHRLFDDLKLAVGTEQIQFHFQPQFDEEGRLIGAEALARWTHPEFGLLLPERFVPLTERFGLVSEFNEAMLTLGMKTLARWEADPVLRDLTLAVNVNGRFVAHECFAPWVGEMLAHHDVDGHRLTIEVTENSIAVDMERARRAMRGVRDLGVRIALDDFGSGFSCLAHLRHLPLDEIKIDGAFVRDIEAGETGRAYVRSILSMSRFLGLTSVAEHVESKGQEAYLRALGCDRFQGFHFAGPMEEDRFVEFARHRAPNSNVIAFAG
jgi:diguanylate cyclase (GGDEF)-like protein